MAKKEEVTKKSAKPAADAKKEKGGEGFALEVYSVVAKKVVAVVKDATITKTSRNAYMLKGVDSEGRNVAGIVSGEKAEHWIAKKMAKKDF
jgi:hypothetical protein